MPPEKSSRPHSRMMRLERHPYASEVNTPEITLCTEELIEIIWGNGDFLKIERSNFDPDVKAEFTLTVIPLRRRLIFSHGNEASNENVGATRPEISPPLVFHQRDTLQYVINKESGTDIDFYLETPQIYFHIEKSNKHAVYKMTVTDLGYEWRNIEPTQIIE